MISTVRMAEAGLPLSAFLLITMSNVATLAAKEGLNQAVDLAIAGRLNIRQPVDFIR